MGVGILRVPVHVSSECCVCVCLSVGVCGMCVYVCASLLHLHACEQCFVGVSAVNLVRNNINSQCCFLCCYLTSFIYFFLNYF